MKLFIKMGLAALFFFGAARLSATGFNLGADIGYNAGVGWFVSSTATHFTRELPLSARLGIGYSWMNPGSATEARKVFINDATNGTPEKGGGAIHLRFDLLFPTKLFGLPNARLYLGPRFARFVGGFKYVGGNEEFDVISNNWGLGLGFESSVAISPKTAFKLDLGTDYFFKATLSGHDTSYAPDGDHVNPRKEYGYPDADNAINQPKYGLRIMIGIATRIR